jgi:hypothetical protein
MTDPATCELIGRWRIVEADLWDRNHLDLVEPAHLQIGNDGWPEFAFGAVNAAAELEDGYSTVLFRGSGFDEGDEIAGIGSVEPQDDGSIETVPITSRFAQECPIISARLAKPRPTETQAYR